VEKVARVSERLVQSAIVKSCATISKALPSLLFAALLVVVVSSASLVSSTRKLVLFWKTSLRVYVATLSVSISSLICFSGHPRLCNLHRAREKENCYCPWCCLRAQAQWPNPIWFRYLSLNSRFLFIVMYFYSCIIILRFVLHKRIRPFINSVHRLVNQLS